MGYLADKAKFSNTQTILKPPTPSSPQASSQKPMPETQFFKGGFLSKIADIISIGQFASAGAAENLLETAGILKDRLKGTGVLEGIKQRKSYIDVLKRVGTEMGKGGLLTGQYEALPGTGEITDKATLINFVKELPVTAIGLAGDIFLDPTTYVGGVGLISKATRSITEATKGGLTTLAKEVPAIEKIGEVMGKIFKTRGGQSELFKEADRARIIAEDLGKERNVKLSTPIIEAPQAIQQRINQIIRGGITTRPELEALAKPIRDEIDRAGSIISQVNPALLDPKTFKANKGTYLGFYYKKYVAPTDELIAQRQGVLGVPSKTRIPTSQLQSRENFAENIMRQIEDFFKLRPADKEAIIQKILNPDIPSLGLSTKAEQLVTALQSTKADLNDLLREFPTTKNLSVENQARIKILLKETDQLTKDYESLINITTKKTTIEKKIQQQLITKQGSLDVLKEIKQPSLEDRLRFLTKNINELNNNKNFISNEIKKLQSEKIFTLDRIARSVGTALKNKTLTLDDLRIQASAERLGKIINQRIRKNLGLIDEAGLPSLLTLEKVNKAEIRSQFFKELVDKDILSDLPDEVRRFQLPNSPQLGASAGKFAGRGDYDAIMQTMRIPGPMEEWWGRALGLWKTFKTAYNPSTIAVNDLTNYLILNPLGGVPAWRLDLYAKGLQEFNKGGEFWNRFRQVGGGLSSQAQAELIDKATALYKTNKVSKEFFPTLNSWHNKVIDFYGSQDTYFKFTNFIKGVTEDGLTDSAAISRANYYLVDYSEMPLVVQWLRKSPFGAPFISFTYGVSLPLAKTLLEHPERLAKYVKTIRAVQSLSQDVPSDETTLPEDLKKEPLLYLKLPFIDQYNRPQYLDLRRLSPANFLETYSKTPFGLGQIPFLNQFLGNPVTQISAGILTNKNAFTNQDIVPPQSTRGEAAMAYMDYMQKQILPSLAPGIPVRVKGQLRVGGFSFDKFLSLIQKRPDFAGRERGAIQTGADILFGVKILPIDENLIKRLNASDYKKQFEDLRKQLISTLLSKVLKQEEKVREVKRIREKIIKLGEEARK